MSDTEEEETRKTEEKPAYKSLIGKMGGHKGFLTKLADSVVTFLDGELTGERQIEAEELRDSIDDRMSKLQDMFDDLLGNANTSEHDIASFEAYVRGIRTKLARLKFKLRNAQQVDAKPGVEPVPPVGKPLGWGDGAIKYPELSLPTFYGGKDATVQEFRVFRQMFEALVGKREEIPLIYKVQYLRGCLPDGSPAKQLIGHIPPTEENYDLHMETLVSRYGNDSGEANRLRRKLMEVGDWPPCNTIDSQRQVIDHVRQHLSLLEQLEEVEEEDMATLTLHILGIVPERIRYKFAKIEKSNRSIMALIGLLERAIISKLEVQSFTSNNSRTSSQSYKERLPSSGGASSINTGVSFASLNQNTNPHFNSATNAGYSHAKGVPPPITGATNELSCVYCRKAHNGHVCSDKVSPDRRRHLLMNERRCFNCLQQGHLIKACPLASQCTCGRGKHSLSICYNQGKHCNSNQKGGHMSLADGSGPTFMETALVNVMNPSNGAWCLARIFIDRGATDSYCTASLAQQLGCEPLLDNHPIKIGTFASDHIKSVTSNLVGLTVMSRSSSKEIPIQLLTMNSLTCGDLPSHPLGPSEMRELAAYNLADYPATQSHALHIDILLGMDYLWDFMKKGVEKTGFGPRLIETEVGWVLSGPLSGRQSKQEISAHFVRTYFTKLESGPVSISDSHLEQVLHRFWDLDTIGVKDEELSPVVAHFQEHVKMGSQGRMEVSVPWKEEIKQYLPVNYYQAAIRLQMTRRKLERPENKELKEKYEKVMSDQLREGIIERVPEQPESVFINGQSEPQELDYNTAIIGTNDPQHKVRCYMPHHAVVKRGSDKVRVVFDASCEAYPGAMSLNEAIHAGPSLLTDLAETLMHFRLHNEALISDIVRAYLNIDLNPDDRDAFRFLWYDGEDIVQYRFARVPFGVIVSSFLLHAVLQSHFRKEFEQQPELLEKILASIYVDDFLSGAEDVEAALRLKEQVEESLGKIGMKLHGWSSSSAVLRERWDACAGEVIQVLGLLWDPVGDTLAVNVARVLESVDCKPTKKNLLSLTASVFDPLGFLQPFLVLPKLLFQQLCKSKLGWRGALPGEMQVKWEAWKQQLSSLEQVQVPRHVVVPEYERVELHCFADASEVAYAACCYIKCVYGADVQVNLAFAKNRIAPVATHTLPRLELLGACLLARVAAKVINAYQRLEFSQVIYYTDSQNVFHWIQSDNRNWSTFVLNRVLELHKLTKPRDWRYVRSERNPADVATRPITGPELAANTMWLHGPTFLYDDTIGCGDKINGDQPTPECLAEVKRVVKVAVVKKPSTILDLSRYSSYCKVINITSYVYKFIAMRVPAFCARGPPTYMELHNMAVRYWVRREQLIHYPNEVSKCPEGGYLGEKVAAVSSIARSLRLFKDQHSILRYSSRVQDPFSQYSRNNPIILPKQSNFTSLYLAHLHRLLSHAGVGELLVHLRKDFWVPQGRQKVRSVIHRCVACRKVNAKPYPQVAPPPLPDFRVCPSHPFEHTGIDTAGPVNYKVGKVTKKGHILVLTCATTRAIHLEFITGISVENVTMGLRRFFATHGLPKTIQSDNAKSFVRCQKELMAVFKSPKMDKYLSDHRIIWKRYLERSPWWGGYIERQVQTVKRSLRKVMGSAVLTFEEYTTFLYEVAALVNSRPISFIYDRVDEGEPVSPAMLMCGKSLVQVPPMFQVNVDGKTPQMCSGRLRYLEKLKTYFWTRWTREYLADLKDIHSRRAVGTQLREPTVGEAVLVRNENLPRGRWKLGLIVGLKPGRDGNVRSVTVRVVRGKRVTRRGNVKNIPTIDLNRSPKHLVPLEAPDMS